MNVIQNHGKLFAILSLTPLGTRSGLPAATWLSWNDNSAIFWEREHIQKHVVIGKLTRMKFTFSLNWKLNFYSIVLVSAWYITTMKIITLIATAYILFFLYEVCYVSFSWGKLSFPHIPKWFQKSTI